MSVDLATALQYYERHGCMVFWNPRDITEENLRTDTPDVEAIVISPEEITSCEVYEGQYLALDGKLEPYEPYPGHEGIEPVFQALTRAHHSELATAAVRQCVEMGWQIMELVGGEDGVFFGPYAQSQG